MKLAKVKLYYNTVKYMKPEQVFARAKIISRRFFGNKRYSHKAEARDTKTYHILPIFVEALDFDSKYIARFDIDGLLNNRVSLLNEEHSIDLATWTIEDYEASSRIRHLWLYNLQYMEYLIPLSMEWKCHKNEKALSKIKDYMTSWISCNPVAQSSDAWSPYTISLRIPNWLIVLDVCRDALVDDMIIQSIYQQYHYLQSHTERHLLGNHYLENLKCLLLCASFFQETVNIQKYLRLLQQELDEQILPDGMHFELSFMYHRIVLEDLLRVYLATNDDIVRDYLIRMAQADCKIGHGLNKVPHFNDAADNIAKPFNVLYKAVRDIAGSGNELLIGNTLGDTKHSCSAKANKRITSLPDAGYYRYDVGDDCIIFDAGEIGPAYIPGHGHNDFASFELYHRGNPVIVNSGTYQYQDANRAYYRSTSAHNTFTVGGQEQSECWGEHRVARRICDIDVNASTSELTMTARNYKGTVMSRVAKIDENVIIINDCAYGNKSKSLGLRIDSYVHIHPNCIVRRIDDCLIGIYYKEQMICSIDAMDSEFYIENGIYSQEFGIQTENSTIRISSPNRLSYRIRLGDNN